MKASTGLFPADCISIIKTYVYIVSNPDTFLSMHAYSGAFQVELSASPPATQNGFYILGGGESELNMIIHFRTEPVGIYSIHRPYTIIFLLMFCSVKGPAAMSNLIVFHSPKHGQSDWDKKRQGSALNVSGDRAE